jgi:regulator of sigma E protease
LAFATVVWVVGRPTAEAEATTVVGFVAPDQPAAKAGFQPGDKILDVDGHPVSRFSGIVNSVTWYIVRSEGETIPFKVQRGNEVLTLNSGYTRPETKGWERRSLRQVGLQPAITPIVAKVTDGSPAARAGLQPNDEVVAVDGTKLYYPQQIFEWAQKAPGKDLDLTVLRDGHSLHLRMEPSRPVIASVIKNGPAEVAGIHAGDRVLTLNDRQIYDPAEVVRFIEDTPNEPFSLGVATGREAPRVVRVLPATPDGRTKPIIGVEFSAESNGGIAWDAGGRMTVAHIRPMEQISAAMQTLTNTIGALMSPQSDIKLQHMSGPVMIMRTYYLLFQSDVGWQLALWFSVVFNINLAIINLLPIPVLDGGHILLALVESVRRRPINLRILEALQGACAIFLIGFMLYVSFYDVQDLPWSSNQKPHFSVPAKPAPPGNR